MIKLEHEHQDTYDKTFFHTIYRISFQHKNHTETSAIHTELSLLVSGEKQTKVNQLSSIVSSEKQRKMTQCLFAVQPYVQTIARYHLHIFMRDGVVWFGCPAKILYTTTHYPTLVTSDLIMEAVCSYQMLAHKYYMVQPKCHVMTYI
jgi:hypothetical protein